MHLIFFTKKGCPNCTTIQQTFFDNEKKHPKLNALDFQTFDAQKHNEQVNYHDIKSVPTVLVCKGRNVLKRFSGGINPVEMSEYLLNKME